MNSTAPTPEDFQKFLSFCDYSSPPAEGNRTTLFGGIDRIDNAIRELDLSKEYFFEYSLLPSAINPKTKKLMVFSGIRTENTSFIDNVEKSFKKIIDTLYPTPDPEKAKEEDRINSLSQNWFHNPETFLFPTIDKIRPILCEEICETQAQIPLLREEDKTKFYPSKETRVNTSTLYYGDLSYNRSIEDMLKASNKCVENKIESREKSVLADSLQNDVKEGAKKLASYYNKYIRPNKKETYYYLVFPIVSAQDKSINALYSHYYTALNENEIEKRTSGLGHFFIYFKSSDNEPPSNDTQWKLFFRINHILSHISLNYVYSTGLALQDQAYRAAVKTAYAQVIARNLSHNIGSHVMANLIKDNIYDDLCDSVLFKVNDAYSSFQSSSQTQTTPPCQLALFNRYLKQRMDYLGSVTHNVASFVTTRMIFGDVMSYFDSQRILLNHISGIPSFKYSFSLFKNESLMSISNDLGVSFPDDTMGCQAFYNILENIIRNTAKHSKPTGKVTFSIHFNDIKDEDYSDIPEAKNLYCVEIDNGIVEDHISSLISDLNKQLNSQILKDGKLRNSGLGLAEMECSAAFLRQIAIESIDSDEYDVDDDESYYHMFSSQKKFNILKAFAKEKTVDDKGVLCYRFFIQKPYECLIVGNEKVSCDLPGVDCYTVSSFLDALSQKTSFPHRFLLSSHDLPKSKLDSYNSLLPSRRLCIENVNDFLSGKTDLPSLKNALWNSHHINSSTITVTRIVDDECSSPQVVFLNHAERFKEQVKLVCSLSTPVFIEGLPSLRARLLPDYNEVKYFEALLEESGAANRIKKELFEAYNQKIVIIDERVQEFAEKNYESSVALWALFMTTNVFIPRNPHIKTGEGDADDYSFLYEKFDKRPVIDLAPNHWSEQLKYELFSFIKKYIEDSFLLIHYGILERVFSSKSKIMKMLDILAKRAKKVIVTSGRGSHSLGLPDSVCFVNLSSVLSACTECRNKYMLFYILDQSRRI